jgi:hypothetical protein
MVLCGLIALFLLGAVLSGNAGYLFGVALCVVVGLFNVAVLRAHRSWEMTERRLIDDWISTLRHELGAEANGAREGQ